ncbi:hypothetical protein CEXT_793131 [Caerostris extrusa]|uniref:Uncharacterized protein n=1 Tax=Caerostris extrusa TaxID=172846 RepID=A0AAV4V5V9_CAEEX|nr:hypothetical protein CEXT_793131 [Caerostris extrusa]
MARFVLRKRTSQETGKKIEKPEREGWKEDFKQEEEEEKRSKRSDTRDCRDAFSDRSAFRGSFFLPRQETRMDKMQRELLLAKNWTYDGWVALRKESLSGTGKKLRRPKEKKKSGRGVPIEIAITTHPIFIPCSKAVKAIGLRFCVHFSNIHSSLQWERRLQVSRRRGKEVPRDRTHAITEMPPLIGASSRGSFSFLDKRGWTDRTQRELLLAETGPMMGGLH